MILAFAAAALGCASGAREPDFTAGGVTAVDVRGGALDVTVVGADTDAVSVTTGLPTDSVFDQHDYSVVHEVKGGTLRLWIEKERLFASADKGRITVIVPRGTEVRVETSSGRVTLEGVEGDVDVRSVSGRIRGERVRLTGDSTFSTVSGDINVGLDTPLDDLRFDLRTISGIVRVGNLRTHRGLHMGFGDVVVTGSSISGSIRFE